VLLTVGRKDLAPFCAAPWHDYVLRSVDPPDAAFVPPGAVVIAARGPFIVGDEIALLRAHRIDVMVTKNSGGDATAAKLEAARALGIEVVMVRRPDPPAGVVVADVDSVLRWLEHQAAALRGV
jgi:precorrin-6A/cobalt-precorrin-6A reductase